MNQRLPKSLRKYIRQEKSRIRREVLDSKKQEKLLEELYKKFFREPAKDLEKPKKSG